MSALTDYFDERSLWIARQIVNRGLAVMNVGHGGCDVPGCRCEPSPVPWSYTIGRVERDLPELLIFSTCATCSTKLCNWVDERDVAGEGLVPDVVVQYGSGALIKLVPVPIEWLVREGDDIFGQWIGHYANGRDVLEPPDVLQIVWADANGRFPDDTGCIPDVVAQQPILRNRPDWAPPPERQPNRAERRRRPPRRSR